MVGSARQQCARPLRCYLPSICTSKITVDRRTQEDGPRSRPLLETRRMPWVKAQLLLLLLLHRWLLSDFSTACPMKPHAKQESTLPTPVDRDPTFLAEGCSGSIHAFGSLLQSGTVTSFHEHDQSWSATFQRQCAASRARFHTGSIGRVFSGWDDVSARTTKR